MKRKRREEEKSHIGGQVEGFSNSEQTKRERTCKDKSQRDAAPGHLLQVLDQLLLL